MFMNRFKRIYWEGGMVGNMDEMNIGYFVNNC